MELNATVPLEEELPLDMGDDDEPDGADEGELHVPSDQGGSISLEKNDRSLSEFYRWYQKGKLIVDPEWQRQYVWDRKRAARLIESLLVDIPIPVIYLAKTHENTYEVIDGLQRLTSIFDFFAGDYPLRGIEIRSDLNNKKFSELDDHLQSKLEDATLRTFELQPDTHKDLMFLIFERLNTGGKPLNDMEIRNCLYRGPLNNLLKELAEDSDFVTAVNQRGLDRRMQDRALILRFLAFYERTHHKAKQGLKRFLNEFFDVYRWAPEEKLREYRKAFSKAMKSSVTVFGDHAFRLRRDSAKGGGEWSTRMNASIFQVVAWSFTEYDLGQITRRADAIAEEFLDLIETDERWVESVRSATGDPSRIQYAFTTWGERLAKVLEGEIPNDSTRSFSKALKQQLYQQDPTCRICGQHITVLLDAALDHHKHYWRGGQTVPDNARLVHRRCNLERGGSADAIED